MNGFNKIARTTILLFSALLTSNAQECDITWVDFGSNATFSGTTLTKTSTNGWNTGAHSAQSILANDDGYFVYEVHASSAKQTIGFTEKDSTGNWDEIDFSFFFTSDLSDPARGVRIFVHGNSAKFPDFGSYDEGDKFRIRRTGSTMYFEKKPSGSGIWSLLHSADAYLPSGSSSLPEMMVDCSINTNASIIKDAKIFCSAQNVQEQDINWIDLNYTLFTGTTLSKDVDSEEWDADAHSSQAIPADADGYLIYEVNPDDKYQHIGFTQENFNTDPDDMEFRYFFRYWPNSASRDVKIYVHGSEVANAGAYELGDKYRIQRVGDSMFFDRKPLATGQWTRLYSASAYVDTVNHTLPELIVDCSLYYVGSKIVNAKISYSPPALQECDIDWTAFHNTSSSGTTLRRDEGNDGWNSDANSIQVIPLNTDGYIVYEVNTEDRSQMIGFTNEENGNGQGDMEFRYYFTHDPHKSSRHVRILVNGIVVISNAGVYNIGDHYRMRRTGDSIYFERRAAGSNTWGFPLYTAAAYIPSNTTDLPQMLVDCCIYHAEATIKNLKISCIFQPYAKPKDKLDGSYYSCFDGQLKLRLEERYFQSNGELDLKIYDKEGLIVYQPTDISNDAGVNLYDLSLFDTGNFINEDYYIVEVENSKGRKEYLRIKYYD